jgi:hypothetical protein
MVMWFVCSNYIRTLKSSLFFQDFMALLAYEEPEKSPMFHLLSPEYRQNVAGGLNRAILGMFEDTLLSLYMTWYGRDLNVIFLSQWMAAHANLPAYSSLERVVQQATVVRQYLQQEVGKVTPELLVILIWHRIFLKASFLVATSSYRFTIIS